MKNLDLSTLPAKKRKEIVSCLRAGIQLLYFLFLPSVFTAAFNGVKYIFTQLGQGEKIEMTAFVSALLLVCAFTIVFGRFFCGFACAFGSLGDAMHAIYGIICKKRKKKPIFAISSTPVASGSAEKRKKRNWQKNWRWSNTAFCF